MCDSNRQIPLISIVVATYNRSNVLSLAVESVLSQTYGNWELIVIGDACTDDTEAVMEAYAAKEPRIRFKNRSDNYGEQSGPNNEGVSLSRGELIAFLNHDDIWLEDHLQLLFDQLYNKNADMVFSLVDYVQPDGSCRIVGATPDERYDPLLFTPASSWLIRRSVFEEVGPWRSAKDLYNIPSQDWCFRAWKAEKKMLLVPHLTVVAVPSGMRRDCYRDRECEVNEAFFQASRNPQAYRARQLTNAVINHSNQWLKRYSAFTLLKWSFINLVRGVAMRLGGHPEAVKNFFRYYRKGGFIRKLRKIRGF